MFKEQEAKRQADELKRQQEEAEREKKRQEADEADRKANARFMTKLESSISHSLSHQIDGQIRGWAEQIDEKINHFADLANHTQPKASWSEDMQKTKSDIKQNTELFLQRALDWDKNITNLEDWAATPASHALLSQCLEAKENQSQQKFQACLDSHINGEDLDSINSGWHFNATQFNFINDTIANERVLKAAEVEVFKDEKQMKRIAVVAAPLSVAEVFVEIADSVVGNHAIYDALYKQFQAWDSTNSSKWETSDYFDVIIGAGYGASFAMDVFPVNATAAERASESDALHFTSAAPRAIIANSTRRLLINPYLSSVIRQDLSPIKVLKSLVGNVTDLAVQLAPSLIEAGVTAALASTGGGVAAAPFVNSAISSMIDVAKNVVVDVGNPQDGAGHVQLGYYQTKLNEMIANTKSDWDNAYKQFNEQKQNSTDTSAIWNNIYNMQNNTRDQFLVFTKNIDEDEALTDQLKQSLKHMADKFSGMFLDPAQQEAIVNEVYGTQRLRFMDVFNLEPLDLYVRMDADPVSACAGPGRSMTLDLHPGDITSPKEVFAKAHSTEMVVEKLKSYQWGSLKDIKSNKYGDKHYNVTQTMDNWYPAESCCNVFVENIEELGHQVLKQVEGDFCKVIKDDVKKNPCPEQFNTCYRNAQNKTWFQGKGVALGACFSSLTSCEVQWGAKHTPNDVIRWIEGELVKVGSKIFCKSGWEERRDKIAAGICGAAGKVRHNGVDAIKGYFNQKLAGVGK